VRALQIPLDALRTELPLIERKLHPRLEPDDLVVLDLQLNAALLSAETAMRLDEPIGLDAGLEPTPARMRQMRAELLDDVEREFLYVRHGEVRCQKSDVKGQMSHAVGCQMSDVRC